MSFAIENGKYVVKASNYNLLNSLWCITITEQGQGKEPIYDFVNKATGEFLAINEADVQGLGGKRYFWGSSSWVKLTAVGFC